MARPAHVIKRIVKLLVSLGVRAVDRVLGELCRATGGPIPARNVVLYYHTVRCDQREPFARQMAHLLRVASPFAADGCPPPRDPGHHAAVTFDDGFASVVENALPELRRLSIPCTLFVPTGCLGRPPSWIRSATHPSLRERVLSEDELRTLARDTLVHLGSHSVSHARLDTVDLAAAADELRRSKRDLERVTGVDVSIFSYPHGARTVRTDEQALQAGYRQVFTVQPALLPANGPCFVAGRVSADPADWPIEFHLKVLGSYRWAAAMPRRALRCK